MAPLVKAETHLPKEEDFIGLSWKENPAAKRLLDTLVSILTEEYIQTAKEHPEIFSE